MAKPFSALFLLALAIVSSLSNTTAVMSPTARILHSVKHHMQQRPVLANSVIGGCLFSGSDAFAQRIEEKPGFDAKRFVSAGAVGAVLAGYVYPFAYRHLDRIWRGKDLSSVAKKSFVEVFTVGLFANSVSMMARGLFTEKKPGEVLLHVKEEMRDVTLNDLRVWFPYNLVAFGYIPIQVRPATTMVMEAAWQTYISMRSNDYQNDNTAVCRDGLDNVKGAALGRVC